MSFPLDIPLYHVISIVLAGLRSFLLSTFDSHICDDVFQVTDNHQGVESPIGLNATILERPNE